MRVSTGRMGLLSFGRRLARDERGATLVYVSLALTVFMGFAALVIDGSRLYTLDTEMQSAADAIALAGAAELDGGADAITRANRAMDNLVQNFETFGDSGTAITGYTARFLNGLPATDADPITAAYVTNVPAEARFVEVRLVQEGGEGEDNSRSINMLFAIAIGGSDTARAGAEAVAGFTQAVCKFTPLFVCNPYDTPGDFLSNVGTPEERRRLIALKTKDSSFPGNFGFLGSVDNETSFKHSLAKVDPGACFEQSGVETQPGNKVSARTALNTRFDLYDGAFNKENKDSDYRPARNVTKGYTGPKCNPSPEPDPTKAYAFPPDVDVFTAPNRMGNGDWDGKFDEYWATNHNGVAMPNGWSTSNLPSRYEVYRWEIESGNIPEISSGEDGNPQCYDDKDVEPNDDPDRRIIYAAVIDCEAYAGTLNGHETGVPVIAFAKMFMTQPMNKKNKDVNPACDDADEDSDEDVACVDTLFVEMIDVVQPGIDDEVVHDIVQLYR